MVTHSLLGWEGFASKPQCPILFHSVIGEDAREARSPSFFNAAEASQVKVYVEQLCGDMKMRGEDVGIISPYNAQVGKIRQLLQKSKTLGQKKEVIRVGSVELFQGMEKLLLVLSSTDDSCDIQVKSVERLSSRLSGHRQNTSRMTYDMRLDSLLYLSDST